MSENLGYCIHVGLDGSRHDIRVGRESVIDVPPVLYLNMYLPDIIRASGNSLNKELLQSYLSVHQTFHGLKRSIYRAVAA